jgi:hypothetical protein
LEVFNSAVIDGMASTLPSGLEAFVSAERAAAFLDVTPRFLLCLARKGQLPAHPLGGPRKVWRFRLSELARALDRPCGDNSGGGFSGLSGEQNV